MIKVCVIGCGMIAKSAHIPAYKANSENYQIVGICDFSKDVARKTAEEFGIENYYTDAEEMLQEQQPEVVSVCAPNMFHKEYTMLALKYGANVLCEKPLAFKLSDAKEMFSFAKKQGKVLMACQSLRFLPERQAVKSLADKGEIGEIYYGEMSRIRRRGIPTWGKFHLKEYSGGGALVDIGVHGIDSAIWLMGNPTPVSVKAEIKKVHANEIGSLKGSGALKGGVNSGGFNPDEMNVESFSSGTVTFENGAILNFKVAWAANLKDENNIVLSGEKCGVDMEMRKIYKGEDSITDLQVSPNGFKDEAFFGHFCLVNNLADHLNSRAELAVSPQETINTTAILEAAYLSAEKGREIFIKEIENV